MNFSRMQTSPSGRPAPSPFWASAPLQLLLGDNLLFEENVSDSEFSIFHQTFYRITKQLFVMLSSLNKIFYCYWPVKVKHFHHKTGLPLSIAPGIVSRFSEKREEERGRDTPASPSSCGVRRGKEDYRGVGLRGVSGRKGRLQNRRLPAGRGDVVVKFL